jgi:hypothetical protein
MASAAAGCSSTRTSAKGVVPGTILSSRAMLSRVATSLKPPDRIAEVQRTGIPDAKLSDFG